MSTWEASDPESGWPADLLLQIGAQTINGISNKRGGARGRTADLEVGQLLTAIQRIQASGAVGLRTEVSKETKQEATVLSLGRKDVSAETLADQALVRKLLGLRPGLREFKVVYGALAESDDVIAIQTRSGFQIMVELAAEIQVPADHVAERRTYPSQPAPAVGPDVLPRSFAFCRERRRLGTHSRPSSITTTGTGSTTVISGPRASSPFS